MGWGVGGLVVLDELLTFDCGVIWLTSGEQQPLRTLTSPVTSPTKGCYTLHKISPGAAKIILCDWSEMWSGCGHCSTVSFLMFMSRKDKQVGKKLWKEVSQKTALPSVQKHVQMKRTCDVSCNGKSLWGLPRNYISFLRTTSWPWQILYEIYETALSRWPSQLREIFLFWR